MPKYSDLTIAVELISRLPGPTVDFFEIENALYRTGLGRNAHIERVRLIVGRLETIQSARIPARRRNPTPRARDLVAASGAMLVAEP